MSEYFGLYRGSVHNVNDPENRGRLQALVPAVLGDAVSAWAEPMLPPAEGLVWAVGDRMWVQFEDGDLNRPVYQSRLEVRTEDLSPEVGNILGRSITTFSGEEDPALDPDNVVSKGDLWLRPTVVPDVDGSDVVIHVLLRRNDANTLWVLVADENALLAVREAQAAAYLADGKMRIFSELAAPDLPLRPITNPVMMLPDDQGDLWFNESDSNKPLTYRADGTWGSVQDVGIVPGTRIAADAVDGKTVTGATVQTAAGPGERLVMRNDGSGGVLESFSGVIGETPGVFDPAGFYDSMGRYRPSIKLQAGLVPADGNRAPYLLLQSASVGGGLAVIDAQNVRIGTSDTDLVRVLSRLRVEGKLDLVTGGSRPLSTMLFGSISVDTNNQGIATHSPVDMDINGPYQVFLQSRLNGTTRNFNVVEKNRGNFKFTVKNADDSLAMNATGITFDYWIVAE